MKSIFKWVHLSDLHFQANIPQDSGFNSVELKSKLPEYLSKIQGVNALIITGDFRFAPSKEEDPKRAAEYIREIAEALKLEIENVYLVPGNHDLKRCTIRNDVIRGLREDYSPVIGHFNAERLHSLKDGFSFFNSLHAELFSKDRSLPLDNPHYSIPLEKCTLLLLNTAITAGLVAKDNKVHDEHTLLLGSQYLRDAVKKSNVNKPIIAIGHHGLEYLEDEEKKVCTKFLEEYKIKLYLCGHAHALWNSSFGENGKEVTVGCLMQDNLSVDSGFSVGQLMQDGTVKLDCHRWEMSNQNWYPFTPQDRVFNHLYPMVEETSVVHPAVGSVITTTQKPSSFSLKGYVLLGSRGIDGIKYIWEKDGHFTESLAFNKRLKDSSDPIISKISAYTCSVSYGCPLSITKQGCMFCETGKIRYFGDVRAEDIAFQNIFMAEYDSDCPSYQQVRENMREFAFMGQGEPGLCYSSVRQAIRLTDYAMDKIGGKVYRYIISTCGITDFMPALIDDIKNHVFQNNVTIHFSLHAIDEERTLLMPVNKDYDYKQFIKQCERLYAVTGEKIGVGILMFKDCNIGEKPHKPRGISLTTDKLEAMLQVLDKNVFRIDLCDVNRTSGISQYSVSNEYAAKLLDVVRKQGFEGKLFSSFGDSEQSGCGMLSSSLDNIETPGSTTNKHFNNTLDLLNEAIDALK